MYIRESQAKAQERWDKLKLLQVYYADFDDFLIDVIEDVMGFKCTDIQRDIGKWVAHGPQYLMVQAQRGQAKTTIAAIYCVWCWIHDPSTRVLIISAGETQANEISNWIIQIMNNMEVLDFMRPDKAAGDRASVEAYDIHYTLKGPEKSPSVACTGITSNLQGKRADVLIPDDIESQKNSQTKVQQMRVEHLSRDFTSICSTGRIVWLGTPQNIDSLYNSLPNRGVSIRIWPGRYPTVAEEKAYGKLLAPLLATRMAKDPTLRTGGGPTGDSGKPIDPVLLDENTLVKKEIDQGPAYFQLQHMLNTTLTDEQRFPLKLGNIRFLGWDKTTSKVPMEIQFVKSMGAIIETPRDYPLSLDTMYRVTDADAYADVTGLIAYIDPAGGGINADEVSINITGMCAGRIFLYSSVGRVGGIDDKTLKWCVDELVKWPKLTDVQIEENYGKGAFGKALQPLLIQRCDEMKRKRIGVEDVWETGQKELRICDILEPIIAAGKLVIHEDIIADDWNSTKTYPMAARMTYSLLWQLSRITRDKDSLIHDDRLDGLAGACRPWVESIAMDDHKAIAAARQSTYKQMMKDPLGDGRPRAFMKTGVFAESQQHETSLSWMNRRPGFIGGGLGIRGINRR